VDDREEQQTERCERCGRTVEAGRLWRLAVALPSDGRVERHICVVCAAGLRRLLLAQQEAEPRAVEAPPPRRRTRVGWFLLRAVVYVAIAFGVFALVTWITSL